MRGSIDSWFRSEVLVHEETLMRYLARAWPNHQDLTDLRQETYVRICEAALKAPPLTPKAFLLSIARHIMSDRRRRERVVSIQAAGDSDFLEEWVDEKTPERQVGAHQELAKLARAFDRLPAKCRKVVWMRRVLDIPQREVARRLSLSERTVEDHVLRGCQLLAQYLHQPALVTGPDENGINMEEFLRDEARKVDCPP